MKKLIIDKIYLINSGKDWIKAKFVGQNEYRYLFQNQHGYITVRWEDVKFSVILDPDEDYKVYTPPDKLGVFGNFLAGVKSFFFGNNNVKDKQVDSRIHLWEISNLYEQKRFQEALDYINKMSEKEQRTMVIQKLKNAILEELKC